MKIVGCFAIYSFFACVAAKNGRSVNVALETVFNFNEKTAGDDFLVISQLRNFLENLQTAVKKRGSTYHEFRRSLVNELDLKNFIKKLADHLLTYSDRDLEAWFKIFDSELRRYDYHDCEVHELLNNPEVTNYMKEKLNQMMRSPTEWKRKNLKHVGLQMENNTLLNYLNKIYSIDSQYLTDFFTYLDQSMLHTREGVEYLRMIIRNGIRVIICEHYTSLNQKTRLALRSYLETYFDKPEAPEEHNKTQIGNIGMNSRTNWTRVIDQDSEADNEKSDKGVKEMESTDLTEDLLISANSRSPQKLNEKKSKAKLKPVVPIPRENLMIESFERKVSSPVNIQRKHISHKSERRSYTKKTSKNTTHKPHLDSKGKRLRKRKKKVFFEIDDSEFEVNKQPTIQLNSFERKLVLRYREMKGNKLSLLNLKRKKSTGLIKKVKHLEDEVKQFKERLNVRRIQNVNSRSNARRFFSKDLTLYSDSTELVSSEACNRTTKSNTVKFIAVTEATEYSSEDTTNSTRSQTMEFVSTTESPTSEEVDPTSAVTVKTDSSTELEKKNIQDDALDDEPVPLGKFSVKQKLVFV